MLNNLHLHQIDPKSVRNLMSLLHGLEKASIDAYWKARDQAQSATAISSLNLIRQSIHAPISDFMANATTYGEMFDAMKRNRSRMQEIASK